MVEGTDVPARREATTAASPRFSTVGLLLGTLFFAFSLTPSLLPRSFAFQGVVSGLSLTLGYAIGRAGRMLWSYLELPVPGPRTGRLVLWLAAAGCALVAVFSLAKATAWQDSVRALMGLAASEGARPFSIAAVALAVFAVLHFLGWQFKRATKFIIARLKRFVPRRIAIVGGMVVAFWLLWAVVDGVVLAFALRTIDQSSQRLDALIEADLAPPDDPRRTGSRESLVAWQDLGRQGRAFVAGGPRAAEISEFHGGAPALDPIRVYVGLNAAETPKERARLARDELIRAGGFERRVLVLATPTGTGWMDPAAHDPVEFLQRGDIATVAVQYSYLPSPVALMAEGAYGAETARALFTEIYGHWTALPREARPKLYLFGLSLGALNSDLSFDLYDVIRDPFHGALWAGPPFRSPSWVRVTESRRRGSPAWRPGFRDGAVVRVMTQDGGLEDGDARWGPFRIAYLQYGSDPITFFSVRSAFREPEWLRSPRAPDVSPELRWYPVVTMVQIAADMAAGTGGTPIGFGHNLAPRDYITAWAGLMEPEGWTPEHTARLQARFADYEKR